MEVSANLENIITEASILAYVNNNRLVTPEHLLLVVLGEQPVVNVLQNMDSLPVEQVRESLREYIDRQEKINAGPAGPSSEDADEAVQDSVMGSYQYGLVFRELQRMTETSSAQIVDVPHLLNAIAGLKDSYAANCLETLIGNDRGTFLQAVTDRQPNLSVRYGLAHRRHAISR